MTGRTWERSFESYADFYRHEYGQYLGAMHAIGSSGAIALEAAQSAGDWSDAATPDLTIAWLSSNPVAISCDLGAGRFGGRQRTGETILIAPQAGASIQVEGSHICRAVGIPYARLLALVGGNGSLLPDDGDFGPLHRGLIGDAELRRLLDGFWKEATSGARHGTLYADGLLMQIVAVLSRLAGSRQYNHQSGGLAPWQVKRATDLLVARIDGELPLSELAAELNLSASHLCRAFKASTGLPPWRWLAERRIERAKELLADQRLSLTDVAQMVGYSGQNTFGEAFRRATGATPGQYRRDIGS